MEVVNASQSMLTNSEMLEVLRENKKLGKEVGCRATPPSIDACHPSHDTLSTKQRTWSCIFVRESKGREGSKEARRV